MHLHVFKSVNVADTIPPGYHNLLLFLYSRYSDTVGETRCGRSNKYNKILVLFEKNIYTVWQIRIGQPQGDNINIDTGRHFFASTYSYVLDMKKKMFSNHYRERFSAFFFRIRWTLCTVRSQICTEKTNSVRLSPAFLSYLFLASTI